MRKKDVLIRLFLLAGIVVVLNLLAAKLYLRLDFTADKRYTLSQPTKEVLDQLQEVITIKAYFSENLPPQLLSSKRDFKDFLVEYENRAKGNLVYEIISPDTEELQAEAQEAGVAPLMINVEEKDQVKQQRAYMGAVLQLGDQSEVIPVVQPGAGLEYALTTAIKKLAVQDKPQIAFLQGHGEPGLRAVGQTAEQLSVLYDLQTYTINDSSEIPAYFKAIAILDPQDTFPDVHLQKLDNYLAAGGSILLGYSHLNGDLQQRFIMAKNDIGMVGWLQDKGLQLGEQAIIDINCASVSVPQQFGPMVINAQVSFPYAPMLQGFPEHPISEGLEAVMLPFVAELRFVREDSGVVATPLLVSSAKSGTVSIPGMIEIEKDWGEQDFNQSNLAAAMALEGPLVGSQNSRLVVVSNGSFATNGEGPQQQRLNADNVNFAANAMEWLADDSGLAALRTKGVTTRPLKPTEDGERLVYKYGNVFIPMLLLLLYAAYRKQRAGRKRQQWIEGNY